MTAVVPDRYSVRMTKPRSIKSRATTVILSPKFQVVIPREIREELHLAAGQKIQAVAHGNRIELIPVRPMRHLRGFLKGLDTEVTRDRDRE